MGVFQKEHNSEDFSISIDILNSHFRNSAQKTFFRGLIFGQLSFYVYNLILQSKWCPQRNWFSRQDCSQLSLYIYNLNLQPKCTQKTSLEAQFEASFLLHLQFDFTIKMVPQKNLVLEARSRLASCLFAFKL